MDGSEYIGSREVDERIEMSQAPQTDNLIRRMIESISRFFLGLINKFWAFKTE